MCIGGAEQFFANFLLGPCVFWVLHSRLGGRTCAHAGAIKIAGCCACQMLQCVLVVRSGKFVGVYEVAAVISSPVVWTPGEGIGVGSGEGGDRCTVMLGLRMSGLFVKL